MTTRRAEGMIRRPQADESSPRPDVRVAALAAEQWGVLSLTDLRACGLSADAITTRVTNGRLHRLHCGVYAVGHANPPVEGRMLGAVKACGPEAFLSHFAAASIVWKFLASDDRFPEVTICGRSRHFHPGIRVHRSTQLGPEDVTRHRGIPVTTPARTLLDLASVAGPRALRRAVRRAQALHAVNIRQLSEIVTRSPGRRGVARLAQVVASGPALTRSELEDIVFDLFARGGLAPPEVNTPLVLGGRRVIPDFRWPAQRLVIEADGARWHAGSLAREDDAERQAILEAHGERVLRVTWSQAVADPEQTLARVRAAGAPPAASRG